jgi:hypothetical protein
MPINCFYYNSKQLLKSFNFTYKLKYNAVQYNVQRLPTINNCILIYYSVKCAGSNNQQYVKFFSDPARELGLVLKFFFNILKLVKKKL